jgi:hypothetical protein
MEPYRGPERRMDPERRRPGRPRAAEPSKAVATWLPATEHDRVIRHANAHHMSVSQFVRHILFLNLR